jgi:hypothetical protein
MSDDFLNQITLNYLISKNQLQKLNKKIKQNSEELLTSEKEIYGNRLVELFKQLLNSDFPNDLSSDVHVSFDNFLERSIYYFKMHDNNENLEKERNTEEFVEKYVGEKVKDEENDLEYELEDEDVIEDDKKNVEPPVIKVKQKFKRNAFVSNGVEDIQKLPLNWFSKVRQEYKQNQIIPRNKDSY